MSDVKINVSFFSKSKIMLATLTLPENETIENLKIKLKSKIQEFKNQEVVIVQEKENGFFYLLSNSDKIEYFKNKTLRAFPRKTQCVIKTSDMHEQREIDVTARVYDIMYNIIDKQPQRYVAGFQKQDDTNSIFYSCSLSMPLCTQGWFHETLFMIRRLYIDDTTEELDSTYAKFLLENCRIANNFSLSCYEIDVWGQLSALQFLYERVEKLTEAYVRQNIARFVSPTVKAENEGELIDRTIFHIRKFAKMDSDSALRLYLVTSATEGCQCSYTEKVKFKVVGAPWFSQTRYLFLCPERIWIAKENTFSPAETAKTSDLLEPTYDGENVIIELLSHTKWSIKSSRPQILMSIINDLIRDPFKDLPDRYSQKQQQILTLTRKPSKTLLLDSEESLAIVAPIMQRNNEVQSDFESDSGAAIFMNKDIDSNLTFPPPNFSITTNSMISQVSTFSLEEETSESVSPKKQSTRINRRKMKPKCIPKIKIPNVIEKEQEIDMKKESMRVIRITKPVDDTSCVIEEETLVPTVEEFFEFNGKEEMGSNKAILFWIFCFYICINILSWLKGLFTKPPPK